MEEEIETSEVLLITEESPTIKNRFQKGCISIYNCFQRSRGSRSENGRNKKTSLPLKQLVAVYCLSLSESFAVNMLFPFIPFMIRDFNVATNSIETGYFIGLVASCFNFSQFLSGFWFGSLSDRFGRRPILFSGLIANLIFMTLFGFSKTLWWALVMRSLNGLFNGNSGVVRSYIREITDSSNQAKAFSNLGSIWGIGSTISPIIGGYLSEPATKYSSIFSSSGLFKTYPYLLPCIISASINLIGVIFGYFYLIETLHISKEKKFSSLFSREKSTESLNSLVELQETKFSEEDNESKEIESKDLSKPEEIIKANERTCFGIVNLSTLKFIFTTKSVILVIICYSILGLVVITMSEVFPIWSSLHYDEQGLGFSSSEIGTVQTIMGVALLFWQTFVYPTVDRKLGSINIFKCSMFVYFISSCSTPFLRLFINTPLLWFIVIAIFTTRSFAGSSAFTSSSILINNSSDKNVGAINGMATSSVAFFRSFGPFVGGALLGWTLDNGYGFPLNYYFIFFLVGFFCLIAFILTFFFPKTLDKRIEEIKPDSQE